MPPLHSTPPPPLGGSLSQYAIQFGTKKLEWSGYPMVKKTLVIALAFSTEYRLVTDRRTDIFPRHSPRYAYASRGKNGKSLLPLNPPFLIVMLAPHGRRH